MADIRATPVSNYPAYYGAGLLGSANEAISKPFGYENEPVRALTNLLGIPAVVNTLENIAYGMPNTYGTGMARQLYPEAKETVGNLLPMAPGAAKVATKGLMETGKFLAPKAGALGFSGNIKPVGKVGLPSPQSLTMPLTPTIEQMKQYGRTEIVPLSKAVSFQSTRNWEKFNAGKHPGELVKGFGDKPLALRLETGEYVIYDGNHRTDLALQKGKTEMPMYVIDVKSYDPEAAGRKPIQSKINDDELLKMLLSK